MGVSTLVLEDISKPNGTNVTTTINYTATNNLMHVNCVLFFPLVSGFWAVSKEIIGYN